MSKFKMKYGLHEAKWGFLERIDGEELDGLLSDEARKNLKYALYEVILDIEVDTETGNIEILGISN